MVDKGYTPNLEDMFTKKQHPILGHCYWYAPHPTESDARCSWCGFIFCRDQEKMAHGAAELVVVLHQIQEQGNYCTVCKTTNVLEPLGDWYCVLDITVDRQYHVTHKKWLSPASEEDVGMETMPESDDEES